jgi:hypothetical protein
MGIRRNLFCRFALGFIFGIATAALGSDVAGAADSKSTNARPTATKLTAAELARQIDVHVGRALAAKKIPVSPKSDDAEFLRRVYLDVAGVIPSLDAVEAFLDDTRFDKRARLIDGLLSAEEYARHMTDQWREFLIPNTAAAARRRHETGIQWLEEAFRTNRPYDEFIRGVLTADGMQRNNGATTFLLTHQSLDEATDRLSRVLLGVQITCAQCHDHPFADWKQDDYWGTAAFFSKVKHQYERIEKVEHYGVSEMGDRKPIMTPPSFKQVEPTFLGGLRPKLDPARPYLPVFVDWLASAENPYFARAFANRLWRKLMGRGLVEPVDDLRDANPGTHPELLALLGEQFRLNGFDVHYLIRAMTLSETYQRTSRPLDANRDDREWYSHMPVKVLTPYMLGDSIQTVMRLGDPPPATPAPSAPVARLAQAAASGKPVPEVPDDKLRAAQRLRSTRDQFASFFRGEENPAPTAYETGMPQALRLMNSQDMFRGSRVVAALGRKYERPESMIEPIYLAVLARRPTEEERRIALGYVKAQPEAPRALNDVVWALLNGTEFVTNH